MQQGGENTQSDQHVQSSLRAPIEEGISAILHFKVHRLDQRQHYVIIIPSLKSVLEKLC